MGRGWNSDQQQRAPLMMRDLSNPQLEVWKVGVQRPFLRLGEFSLLSGRPPAMKQSRIYSL